MGSDIGFEPIGKGYDTLYAELAELRETRPVYYWAEHDCWVFTRYDDIAAALKDPAHFTNEGSLNVMNGAYTPEATAILQTGIDFQKTPQVNALDGADHTRVRSVMQKILTPQRFRRMEPTIRTIVAQLIDSFVQQGECEVVSQFCYPLPVNVIFDVIGFDAEEEDLVQLQTWSDNMFRLWLVPMAPEEQIACARDAVRFQDYIRAKLEQRRSSPRDDLLTEFVQELDSGESRLSEDEVIIMFPMNLIGAGHETTKSMLANSIYQLLREPARWQALLDDPGSAMDVVDEMLRLDSSVLCWYRTVRENVEVGGVKLDKGARIVLALGAGNHDPAKFADPASFCPARGRRVNHLSFSTDKHFCPGAPLARLELKIALEELARRLPGLRIKPDTEVRYEPSVATRVIAALPLEWDASAASKITRLRVPAIA